MIEIRNKQVKEIHDRWNSIWEMEEQDENVRLKAFVIKEVIETLVCIYEYYEEVDNEQVDDLFISWRKDGLRPVFPEEMGEITTNLRKRIDEMKRKVK